MGVGPAHGAAYPGAVERSTRDPRFPQETTDLAGYGSPAPGQGKANGSALRNGGSANTRNLNGAAAKMNGKYGPASGSKTERSASGRRYSAYGQVDGRQ